MLRSLTRALAVAGAAFAAAPVTAQQAPLSPEATAGMTGPLAMTAEDKDALRGAVQACWDTSPLSAEALQVTVTLRVAMSQDGRPQADSVEMLAYEGGSEAAALQAFEVARRAILRCGSDGYDLPAEGFEQWKEIEMIFSATNTRLE